MFINNTRQDKQSIGPVSFQGYNYTIPAGVSACDDAFGEYFLSLHKPDGRDAEGKIVTTSVPAILPAERSEWKGNYVHVERFKIDAKYVPSRTLLINKAEDYGVDKDTVNRFRSDETIDNDVIVEAINAVPVPEHIRVPETESEEPTTKIDEDLII